MSTTVMAACWPLLMPPAPKAVLMSLADNANDHGECWPSIPTICARTCYGRTAVIDAIKYLEQQLLVVADRTNGRHTRYRITVTLDLFANIKPVRHADRSAKRTSPPREHDPSATRTAPVRQADSNRQEPSRTEEREEARERADSPGEDGEQTQERPRHEVVALALERAGVIHVNRSHPKLIALLAAGVDPGEMRDVAVEIVRKDRKKATLPYVLGVIEGRRRDAAAAEPIPDASAPVQHALLDRANAVIAEQRDRRARAGPRRIPADLARTLGLSQEPPTP